MAPAQLQLFRAGIHHFETIPLTIFETGHSPFAPNAAHGQCKPACRAGCLMAGAGALSVRLSSL